MAKHMAGAPEKTQRTHLKHESEKQPVQADTGKRYRAEVPQSETSYDNGKRYKKEKTESSRPKREEHTSTHSNPTRTISEGGMNHLAARLEERDERRYAACRAAYGERRTQQSPARLRTEDEPVVRKSKAMKTARMKLPAHVLKSRAKLILAAQRALLRFWLSQHCLLCLIRMQSRWKQRRNRRLWQRQRQPPSPPFSSSAIGGLCL